jgi:hypothetical protein
MDSAVGSSGCVSANMGGGVMPTQRADMGKTEDDRCDREYQPEEENPEEYIREQARLR